MKKLSYENLSSLRAPDKETFNGQVAEMYYRTAIKKGHEVRFQKLDEMTFDPILWKGQMPILWRLKEKIFRYGELRELEENGFIKREVFPVVPPKVEYSITKKGRDCIKVIEVIRNYGIDLMHEAGLPPKYKKTSKV